MALSLCQKMSVAKEEEQTFSVRPLSTLNVDRTQNKIIALCICPQWLKPENRTKL